MREVRFGIMKIESDHIMLKIEGTNGRCFIQFDGGYPTLWCGGVAHSFDLLTNIGEFENLFKMIIKQVGE